MVIFGELKVDIEKLRLDSTEADVKPDVEIFLTGIHINLTLILGAMKFLAFTCA